MIFLSQPSVNAVDEWGLVGDEKKKLWKKIWKRIIKKKLNDFKELVGMTEEEH